MNELDCTELVYKFACKGCSMSYIGETKRALNTRLEDHIKNKNPKSVVSLHKSDEHKFDWDKVIILDRESHWYKRQISEMLFISCEDNALNKKEDIKSLNRIYRNILNTFE